MTVLNSTIDWRRPLRLSCALGFAITARRTWPRRSIQTESDGASDMVLFLDGAV